MIVLVLETFPYSLAIKFLRNYLRNYHKDYFKLRSCFYSFDFWLFKKKFLSTKNLASKLSSNFTLWRCIKTKMISEKVNKRFLLRYFVGKLRWRNPNLSLNWKSMRKFYCGYLLFYRIFFLFFRLLIFFRLFINNLLID